MAAKTKKPKHSRPRREPRERSPKQGYLDPAMAPVSLPDLDDAAEDYRRARDARMEMGTTEQECAETLLKLMQQHNLAEYEYDAKIVRIVDLRKVKVTKAKAEKASTNGDE